MDEAKKQCVLVVDDNPRVLRFIEIGLKLHGFDVLTTVSGEEALSLVKSSPPDIILLDIIMSGMDGFEVLRGLRDFKRLPVIAFSASSDNYYEAMQLGADDFITKPFDPDDLMRRINTLLGR